MAISERDPVQFDDPLPEAADVVIVGAGVIGVSTALFLAEAGHSVLVCEKGRVAGEQSSRNWGWVRQQGRDPDELPIMMESIRLWDGMAERIGADVGFVRKGVLYLAETESDQARFEAWAEIAREHQLDTRLLTPAEVESLAPGIRGPWRGGLFTASDGRAEPFTAVPAMARSARERGVAIAENCAVRTVETEAGRVAAVATERGRVRTSAVVCAAGHWSSTFLRNLGIDLPQLSVKATVARTAAVDGRFEVNAAGPDLAMRRRRDGGYTLAIADFHEHYVTLDSFRHLSPFMPHLRASWREIGLRLDGGTLRSLTAPRRWTGDDVTVFERRRVLDPPPSRKALARMRSLLPRRLPALAETPIVEAWAGMIDTLPDVVPAIGEAAAPRGLFLATGFSGHGFGIGPGAGRVLADLVRGNAPGHDLSRFRPGRFADGTPIRPGPAL